MRFEHLEPLDCEESGEMATEIATGDDCEDRGSGWLVLAGTVLGLAGLMRIIDAIWAFRYNG